MSEQAFRLDPPSDAQLAYIHGLCDERGLEPPAVVASKQEASRIIAEIRARQYNPEDYVYPFWLGAGSAVLGCGDRYAERDRDFAAEDAWHAHHAVEGDWHG